MVGDTDADILAGKAAGVATCAVTYTAPSPPKSSPALHPDFVIDAFAELPGIAGGL